MLKQLSVAFLLVAIASTASEARYLRSPAKATECNVTMPCDLFTSQSPRASFALHTERRSRQSQRTTAQVVAINVGHGQIVSGRPSGCPNAFCGCGASIRVFGRIVPELNLASNWLRFPRTTPAPGMVAARRGHVFVLEQHVAGDTWMAYDANSGGRATRIHARSLRGYAVVNPHA